MKITGVKKNQKNSFHLVDNSPWPFFVSTNGLAITFGAILYMHNFSGGIFLLFTGVFSCCFVLFFWWADIIRESTFEGHHTKNVETSLRIGMILFIMSEIMFFFAFFWAFFYSSFAPTFNLGGIWAPKGIFVLNPFEIPLLNTVILLISGIVITWSHSILIAGFRKETFRSLFLTIFLAVFFTFLQVIEYYFSNFSISDSIYGSTFFLTTGFHGFHVFIGTFFLIICSLRLLNHNFSTGKHFGLEAAIWYWHFVDVVWLFLFVSIYWWGS